MTRIDIAVMMLNFAWYIAMYFAIFVFITFAFIVKSVIFSILFLLAAFTIMWNL